MPAETNQIENDEGEKEGKEADTAFVIDNQKQLIHGDAFQLQEDFVHLDEGGDEKDLTEFGE